jgi:hypothetical protein
MNDDTNEQEFPELSRRDLFKGGVVIGVGALVPPQGVHAAPPAGSPETAEGSAPPLSFVNGRIHTMDDERRVVKAAAIRDGRFVAVGNPAYPGSGVRVINLHGRTVVPGLIESHTHFVSLANRPGYHVAQWELASNIGEVLALLAARRRDVPEGQFITAMGAGTPRMFAELRLPTLAELDGAVPDRPVFLYQGGGGPARTNTLGKQFFESATAPLAGPCVVGDDGSLVTVGGVNHANRALYHLRVRQTFEDKKRSALDAMALGEHRHHRRADQTLVAVATGTPDPASLDPQPTHAPSISTTTACTTRGWPCTRGPHAHPPADKLPAQPGIHPRARRSRPPAPERERLKNQFPLRRRHGKPARSRWAAPFATPSSPDNYAVRFEAQRLVAKARYETKMRRPAPDHSDSIGRSSRLRGHGRGIRHPGPALGPAARGLRNSWTAKPAQEPELRRVDVRLPLAERRPARRRVAGGAALPADHRERHPGRPA